MFFDQSSVDTVYQQLLLSIARKQRELLLFRFDWKKRVPKAWPPKNIFGRIDKKALSQYDALVQELNQLKEQTITHRRKEGYTLNSFWWNLPWEQVESILFCDLTQYEEDGAWRFQWDWEVDPRGDFDLLILRENGHFSNFSSHRSTNYARESNYTEAQQSAMVSELRSQMRDHDFQRLLFSSDRPVYSYKTKTLYRSDADYVLSAEHYFHQQNQIDRFERSLYTEHITQEVSVVSNSRHYECLFAVGGFHVDAYGMLDLVAPLDFEILGSRGSVPSDLEDSYRQKDAAVSIAAYLADRSDVTQVPMQLFGRDIMDAAPDYTEAMRQAELYTCLAHKIKLFD